jgi:hypothetical protein
MHADPGALVLLDRLSRSATLTSFAASPASDTDVHSRRRPPSDHTARHRSPATALGTP